MANPKVANLTVADFTRLKEKHGSLNLAADALKVPRETFKGTLRRLMRSNPYTAQQMPAPIEKAAPRRGKKCFIFSSAQNNTEIDESFMDNLEAYASHLKAEVHISGFTYAKHLFESSDKSTARFHPRVEPYLTKSQFDIGGKLLFCGEMNTLPTADKPLQGFGAYTRSQWGIFPHPRVQLESVATMFGSPPKIIMTTGAVTKRNYIQKKAGIKAEFHHVIGAVLVEIDDDGDFFCRHLIAEKDGSFQDLDIRVEKGKVTNNWRVEAITWGDIHTEYLDEEVAACSWGIDNKEFGKVGGFSTCMLDELEPKYQFFHDVLDFRRRNHHNIKDPHVMFEMWARETENVENEIIAVSCFLHATRRDFAESVVVDSNHDRALNRWLKEADYKKDPVNARFFLQCQAKVYEAIETRNPGFLLAEWAIKEYLDHPDTVRFLKNTDSFVICPKASGGIECALHGDQGANGAKGSVNSFAKMGPKATTAHDHGAAIFEGIARVGTSSKLDMVYNRGGLSSWNHSHLVTYPSGKRTIITLQNGKWRA